MGHASRDSNAASVGLVIDRSRFNVPPSRVPTWRHHCLAHVLSDDNAPTLAGNAEVWGGPLSGGDYVLALLNRGGASRDIHAPFAAFEIPGVGPLSSFDVSDLWHQRTLGNATGAVHATVPPHDMVLYRLRSQHTASAPAGLRQSYL